MAHPVTSPPSAGRDVFIARQPILDIARHVIGYELLFRGSDTAEHFSGSPEQATAKVISEVVGSFGLDVITHRRLAFINITRSLLLDGAATVLPPKGVVLELLESIEADAEVMAACRHLKQLGYTLALDDFLPTPSNIALVPLVDYVKLDLPSVSDIPAWVRAIGAARPAGLPALVAERVETAEDFARARDAGMTHVQGFFFGKPATQRTRKMPDAQLGYLRLMQALRDPDLSLAEIEELIRPDAALCFRVLRTVNSAGFGLRAEVGSIREALILLGREPVKRWVSLWTMVSFSRGSHSELLLNSLVRARMCELLGQSTGDPARGDEGFLLGMCSLIDAILDAPMDVIVAQLPLDESIRAALLGDDNPQRRMLEAVIAYERGDWDEWVRLAERAGLSLDAFGTAAADALNWAHDVSGHGVLEATA